MGLPATRRPRTNRPPLRHPPDVRAPNVPRSCAPTPAATDESRFSLRRSPARARTGQVGRTNYPPLTHPPSVRAPHGRSGRPRRRPDGRGPPRVAARPIAPWVDGAQPDPATIAAQLAELRRRARGVRARPRRRRAVGDRATRWRGTPEPTATASAFILQRTRARDMGHVRALLDPGGGGAHRDLDMARRRRALRHDGNEAQARRGALAPRYPVARGHIGRGCSRTDLCAQPDPERFIGRSASPG